MNGIVVAVTVLFVMALAIFQESYVEPYDSALGQAVLVMVLALFALGFMWMRRLSTFDLPERFMFGARDTTGASR